MTLDKTSVFLFAFLLECCKAWDPGGDTYRNDLTNMFSDAKVDNEAKPEKYNNSWTNCNCKTSAIITK